jgi:parallel beta-helix repeat protein
MLDRNSALKKLAFLAFGAAFGVSAVAEARTYGELHITKSTTLSTDHYGSIVFDADAITLDCRGYMVHSSQDSRINCRGGRDKCAIVADGRDEITIKNCKVVGQFNVGVHVRSAVDAYVSNVNVNTESGTAFDFDNDLRVVVTNLTALENNLGLHVRNDTDGYFSNVDIDSPNGVGVFSYRNYGTVFDEITTDNCQGASFYSGEDRDVTLQYSDISNGRGLGFFARLSNGLLISNNTVLRNGDYGITLSGTSNSDIIGNYAFDNRLYDAIQHSGSTGNTWSDNQFGTKKGF